jgi:hypothetical protein
MKPADSCHRLAIEQQAGIYAYISQPIETKVIGLALKKHKL